LEPPMQEKYKKIRIMDSIEWCRNLLPRLQIREPLSHVVLHPTCSMTHLKLTEGLEEIARKLAVKVEIPIGAACCGTAGDRGLLHPELVKSATKEEAKSVSESHADAYLSANRTCEMGMHHATGKPYESYLFTLERLSRTN
jgi:D-lactate dehydrogenase